MKRIKLFAAGILIGCIILSSCSFNNNKNSTEISDTGFYFDTVITITLYDKTKGDALEHCFELADTFESYFSDTISDSDVSRINSNAGIPVKVHRETAELIARGLDYSKRSNGAFDITVGRLLDLWSFEDQENGDIPDKDDIKAALSGIDFNKVSVDGDTVTLADDACAIDLGGIAKGYIADKMKEYLESEGISSGLINLGGNVLTLDEKPDGRLYTIGIQKPFSTDGTPALSLEISARSVVTSGNYQRYFEKNGKVYHHILDTKTGYPCDNSLDSVTIISDRSTDGDALSTMVFLMGLDKGLKYVDSLDDVEAVFITSDGRLHYTAGFKDTYKYKEY